MASLFAGTIGSLYTGAPGRIHWFQAGALGAPGGALEAEIEPLSRGLPGGGGPRSAAFRGATGGARIAFGAVGIFGLCRIGEVLKECEPRGPLGAAGGGVPSLGGAISGRPGLGSLLP